MTSMILLEMKCLCSSPLYLADGPYTVSAGKLHECIACLLFVVHIIVYVGLIFLALFSGS